MNSLTNNLTKRTRTNAACGFSLVELLTSVAALSSLTAIAVFTMGDIFGNTAERKLQADVASVNSAVRVYKANGGKIVGSWKADKILLELKTVADATSAKKLAGLRGSLLDPRVEGVMETFAEAAQGNAKVLWDSAGQRFYIAHTNERGIKNFRINDALADAPVGERVRDANLELAVVDTWIWDYEDRGGPTLSAPSTPGNPTGGSSGGAGAPGDPLTLNPPEFSLPGGTHPLPAFDLEVSLTNPNPPGVSEIQYSVTPGVWLTYGGEVITMAPDDNIEAYVASLDTANWTDSSHSLEAYTTIPVPLVVGLRFSKHTYTYAEMGGAMIPGIYPPEVVDSGTVSLLNADEIPPQYLNPTSFGIVRIIGPSNEQEVTLDDEFSGPVPISLADYGTASEATFEVIARSNRSEIIDSVSVSETVGIEPTLLRAPIVLEVPPPSGPPIAGEHWVEINMETDLGDMPVGAHIYYTTDGSDPGDSNGFPTSPTAQLYEGAFSIAQPPTIPIQARVYAPTSQEQWFVTSEVSHIVWPTDLVITFSMEVWISTL